MGVTASAKAATMPKVTVAERGSAPVGSAAGAIPAFCTAVGEALIGTPMSGQCRLLYDVIPLWYAACNRALRRG
jgi:hypothetical protein